MYFVWAFYTVWKYNTLADSWDCIWNYLCVQIFDLLSLVSDYILIYRFNCMSMCFNKPLCSQLDRARMNLNCATSSAENNFCYLLTCCVDFVSRISDKASCACELYYSNFISDAFGKRLAFSSTFKLYFETPNTIVVDFLEPVVTVGCWLFVFIWYINVVVVIVDVFILNNVWSDLLLRCGSDCFGPSLDRHTLVCRLGIPSVEFCHSVCTYCHTMTWIETVFDESSGCSLILDTTLLFWR